MLSFCSCGFHLLGGGERLLPASLCWWPITRTPDSFRISDKTALRKAAFGPSESSSYCLFSLHPKCPAPISCILLFWNQLKEEVTCKRRKRAVTLEACRQRSRTFAKGLNLRNLFASHVMRPGSETLAFTAISTDDSCLKN